MATADAFTNESDVTSNFNPADTISEFFVDGTFSGTVKLQAARPSTTVWHDVVVVIGEGNPVKQHFTLHTPDSAVLYRAMGLSIVGTANFYFGP